MRSLPILLCLIAFGATAQPSEVRLLDSLVRLSQRHYNARQPDSIYRLLTPEFKQQISADGWRSFLLNTFTNAGRWQKSELVGKKGGFSNYKATFERDTFLFQLAADPTGRIAGFGLSPYVVAIPVINAKAVPSSNPLRTLLDRQLDSVVQTHAVQHPTVGLCIGLLRNDSLFVYGYGETAIGNAQLPNGNTLFEIGSVTKTFTATLLADAVRRGLIRLDDPVNKYLPDSIPSLQKDGVIMTIQMLSNHTSGLPRLPGNMMVSGFAMQNPYQLYDRKALFAFLKTVPLINTPGTTYQYSNLAVGLLGTILESVGGQSHEQQLKGTITRPLGMKRTLIRLSDAEKTALAQGHTAQKQLTPNWDFKALAGAGAIRSTVNDLLLYLQTELGKGPKALVASMQSTQQISFRSDQRMVGLGWHHNPIGKATWLLHNGGTGGYVSFAGFNLANKTAVVVLSNTAVPIDATAIALIKTCRL